MVDEYDPFGKLFSLVINWLFSERVRYTIKCTLLGSYAALLSAGWCYIVFFSDVEWFVKAIGVYALLGAVGAVVDYFINRK